VQYDRHKRPTAADLVSVIVRVSTTLEGLAFCGICCTEEGPDITDDLVDGYSEKHATEVETPKQVKPPRRLEMSTSRTIISSSVPGAFLNSHCSNCFELLSNGRFQCGL
jgi:hypothetical protein